MNHIPRLVVAATLALPLAAIAQTPSVAPASKVLPADTPRSNLEKQQTEQSGTATKYGETGSADAQASQTDATPKKTKKPKVRKNDAPDTTDTTTTPK